MFKKDSSIDEIIKTLNNKNNEVKMAVGANLKLENLVSSEWTVIDDVVEYKIIASNIGDIKLEEIIIYEEFRGGIGFIKGTLKINNIPFKEGNILSGVEIGDLEIGETKIIVFEVEILSDDTRIVESHAIGNAKFKLPIEFIIRWCKSKSEVVETYVNKASLYISKEADLKEAGLSDTITYKVTLLNDGTLGADSIIFKDNLDNSTKFIEGSFKVNNEVIHSVDIENGVKINGLDPIEILIIEYKVEVIDTNCTGIIENRGNVKFQYMLQNGECGKKDFEYTQVINAIKSRISSFKQVSLESKLELPKCKPDIESVNEVRGEAIIKGCHIIETGKGISQEGQKITGYKLIVSGFINIILNYTANEEEQGVHAANYKIYFTEFVVLSENFVAGSKVAVNGLVEDVYYNLCEDRSVFVNATVLLDVKIGNYI
ncbi:DUF11 domain-containing protein [uncultured Clostridium sp.]|jgi:uncharacterized repeat protein (TIGR01451 family)|uniref:DUF11 domain-containing protein n=1 Tax=uncultured Clostridium sp. TaxID=59620 RepID=UPI0026370D57|nr:DUF11 domain-containing protein [uncultured Clostridium sp.]